MSQHCVWKMSFILTGMLGVLASLAVLTAAAEDMRRVTFREVDQWHN